MIMLGLNSLSLAAGVAPICFASFSLECFQVTDVSRLKLEVSLRALLLLLKCCSTSTETVGLLGTGAQDVHLDFHTAPELCALSEAWTYR